MRRMHKDNQPVSGEVLLFNPFIMEFYLVRQRIFLCISACIQKA
jgi:hypothetical protein